VKQTEERAADNAQIVGSPWPPRVGAAGSRSPLADRVVTASISRPSLLAPSARFFGKTGQGSRAKPPRAGALCEVLFDRRRNAGTAMRSCAEPGKRERTLISLCSAIPVGLASRAEFTRSNDASSAPNRPGLPNAISVPSAPLSRYGNPSGNGRSPKASPAQAAPGRTSVRQSQRLLIGSRAGLPASNSS
jgi:hypothetical protein